MLLGNETLFLWCTYLIIYMLKNLKTHKERTWFARRTRETRGESGDKHWYRSNIDAAPYTWRLTISHVLSPFCHLLPWLQKYIFFDRNHMMIGKIYCFWIHLPEEEDADSIVFSLAIHFYFLLTPFMILNFYRFSLYFLLL